MRKRHSLQEQKCVYDTLNLRNISVRQLRRSLVRAGEQLGSRWARSGVAGQNIGDSKFKHDEVLMELLLDSARESSNAHIR